MRFELLDGYVSHAFDIWHIRNGADSENDTIIAMIGLSYYFSSPKYMPNYGDTEQRSPTGALK